MLPEISRALLERESRILAQRLSVLHGINAPEFFDKRFSTLVSNCIEEGYLKDNEDILKADASALYQVIAKLMSPEIRLTIESVGVTEDNNSAQAIEENPESAWISSCLIANRAIISNRKGISNWFIPLFYAISVIS